MAIAAFTERLGRLLFRHRDRNGGILPPKDENRCERSCSASINWSAMPGRGASHQLATGRTPDKLISRLDENEAVLVHTYDLVTAAVKRNRRISPAAEWLLDNFYLIEDQIRTARRHLPRSYSRELPRLPTARSGHPRVYGIALELISHVDGRVDAVSLNAFIAAYQTVAPLQLGELWAIPIMLRLALIENLRRVAARVAAGRRDRDLADDWAERMVQVVEQNPTDLILVLADMARANPPLSGRFLAELTRHLQGQSPHFAFANSWLEHRLSEQGQTIERWCWPTGRPRPPTRSRWATASPACAFSAPTTGVIRREHSLVEQILRGDPAGCTRGWTSPRATATATGSRRSPSAASLSEYDVAAARWQPGAGRPCGRTGCSAEQVLSCHSADSCHL